MRLLNIEKLFTLIPTTIVFIVFTLVVLTTYMFLNSKEKRELDLLNQKAILENQFQKKELLNQFKTDVEKGVDSKLSIVKKSLQEHTYKIIGSLSHHLRKENPSTIVDCLTEYECDKEVSVTVFKESSLEILYGEDKIEYLSKLIFGNITKKSKKLVLQYIASQGKNNLQEWKNDLVGTLKLSFFDKLEYKDEHYFVGTFSIEKNIRSLRKKIISEHIDFYSQNNNYHIWFYDKVFLRTYNFNNNKQYDKIERILPLLKKDIDTKYLMGEVTNGEIKQSTLYSIYNDYTNKLSIVVSNIKPIEIDQTQIEKKYRFLFFEYLFYIFVFFLLLFFVLRHLSYLVRIRLYAQTLKKQVKEELEKNRQKDQLLIQQNKLASMGEMLGNISHQWRQPLNNVSLFLQFIQSNYKNEKIPVEVIEKYFHKSFVQIKYMSQTIDDFRNFYKPSTQKEQFSLQSAIDSTIEIIEVQLKESDITIERKIGEEQLYGFQSQFKQVVLNILSNAHHAIKKKQESEDFHPFIKIEVTDSVKDIIINISNNGGSIDETILAKVFEPYFTTKFESQGTGIGLYMAKSIIEVNFQGTIDVHNTPDGVCFRLKIPL